MSTKKGKRISVSQSGIEHISMNYSETIFINSFVVLSSSNHTHGSEFSDLKVQVHLNVHYT